MLHVHEDIIEKLKYFNESKKIPNIIFHGQAGSGKKTIVDKFINMIYDSDKEKIKSYVMYVNSGFGKGIKFIREDLKFFAKTNIINSTNIFKTIVLLNADKLTVDAQSALRRCIELFSHTTRFFIIVEDKSKLLKPILSRFCDIYIPEPACGNLYICNNKANFDISQFKKRRFEALKREIMKNKSENVMDFSLKLYEKGYSGLDIINLVDMLDANATPSKCFGMSEKHKYDILFFFNKISKEIRNEEMLMSFLLIFIFEGDDSLAKLLRIP